MHLNPGKRVYMHLEMSYKEMHAIAKDEHECLPNSLLPEFHAFYSRELQARSLPPHSSHKQRGGIRLRPGIQLNGVKKEC